ncbi:MAG: ABC transporter permease [Bacteroidales bacterium]|jgi:ribose transport system permease protein|nr:ABC transporter permease [Bacteroidales bacterium]
MKNIYREIIGFISKRGVVVGFAILMLVLSILTPNFFTASNLMTVTLQISVYALLACGIAYVLIVAGAELSAGSIVGLTGMCFVVGLKLGLPVVPSIIFGLLSGLACGLVNGFLVTKMHLIPFIATLGTQYVYRGFTNLLTTGTSVSVRALVTDEWIKRLTFLGGGKVLGFLPVPTIVVFFFALVHHFILSKTILGRRIYAVGSNEEAARLSGINKDKVTIVAYCMSGLMAGVAGIMLTCRLMSALPTAGMSYELEGIAAGVIGGVSMMGGQGTIIGALLGALIIGVMRNGLNLIGVNTYWQMVFTGAIIIFAVFLDIIGRYRSENTN